MAYLSGRLVQLVSPQNGARDVPLDTPIRIWFAKDMDVSTVTSETIKVFNDRMESVSCSVRMDPSSPTRIAVVTPDDLLEPLTRYSCVVVGGEMGIKSVKLGDVQDFLLTDYNWNFTTSSQEVLTAPLLLDPIDQSLLYDREIVFKWTPVDSAERYQMQISTSQGFSPIVFTNDNITSNIYTPSLDIVFEPPKTYYWRVRAINSDGSPGVWSLRNQFYIDDPIFSSSQDSSIYPFEVMRTVPADGSAEIYGDTVGSIVIEFSSALDESSITPNALIIKSRELEAGLVAKNVSGEISVSGEKLVFSPEHSLEENSEYIIYLSANISDINGNVLGEQLVFSFVTIQDPYYCTVEIVRTDLGLFIKELSDIDISKSIHKVSLWADQVAHRPYGSLNSAFPGRTQSQTTNKIFFHEYVRYETELRLLMRRTLEHAISKGEAVRLGDFSKEMTGSLAPDINVAVKRLERNRDIALEKLTMGQGTSSLPAYAVLGGTGDPPRHDRKAEY